MSAVFTPTRYKLTVEDYHKLGEAGVLKEDSRVELIDGELIEMAPIGPRHAGTVTRLNRMLSVRVGELALVWPQNPVLLPRARNRNRTWRCLSGEAMITWTCCPPRGMSCC